MTHFGLRLKFLRQRKGLTQANLGNLLNVSASTIGMYERGEREPSFKVLKSIAQYFDTSIDYLLDHHTNSENRSTLSLTKEEEEILTTAQQFPRLFDYLQTASTSQVKQMIKILNIISNE